MWKCTGEGSVLIIFFGLGVKNKWTRFLCLFHLVRCLLRAVQTNKPVPDDFTNHPVGDKWGVAKVFFVSADSSKWRRSGINPKLLHFILVSLLLSKDFFNAACLFISAKC